MKENTKHMKKLQNAFKISWFIKLQLNILVKMCVL